MDITKFEQVVKELQSRLSFENKSRSTEWGHVCRPIPKIDCADGTTLSVQASSGHYCDPRSDKGPYWSVEVGFPSVTIESFMDYIEDSESGPTRSVYGWVPIYVVAQAILDHGGFAEKF
jgi:hypothetical protein